MTTYKLIRIDKLGRVRCTVYGLTYQEAYAETRDHEECYPGLYTWRLEKEAR